MAVYLLHSSVPLVRSDGTPVQHYVGWAPDGEVLRRLGDHLLHRHPARLVEAFLERGAILQVGYVWPELTREDERRVKSAGHLDRRCYLCRIERLSSQHWAMLDSLRPAPRSGSEQ